MGTAVSWYENLPDRSHVDMAVKTLLNDHRSDNVYVRVAMATQVLNDRPYNSYQYCPLVQEMEAEDFQQADAEHVWTAYRPCVDLWDAVTIGGRRLFDIR